jgi:hypothetical protein
LIKELDRSRSWELNESAGKHAAGGVYVRQHLSFPATWKISRGKAKVRTVTGEIPLSGIAGGLVETRV